MMAERKCKHCGSVLDEPRKPYEQSDLLLQTPPSVWELYRENGYTLAQAMREELSCA